MKVHKRITYVSDDGFEFIYEPIEASLKIKKTKDGFVARYLVQDLNPMAPNEGDSPTVLVNYHRQFWVEEKKVITKEECIQWYREGTCPQMKTHWIFPLTCLIHSGVALSLNRSFMEDPGGWDTSHVGLVLSLKEIYKTEAKAMKAAECLIEEWNQYLSGDVYGIARENYDSKKSRLDHDSVWGFYGYDYALSELAQL